MRMISEENPKFSSTHEKLPHVQFFYLRYFITHRGIRARARRTDKQNSLLK
jgi:hypothetical protein